MTSQRSAQLTTVLRSQRRSGGIEQLTLRLSYVMIFVIPFENIFEISGTRSITRALGYVVAALWLLLIGTRGHARKLAPFHGFYFAFVLWSGLSIYWSLDRESTIEQIFTHLQLAGLLMIVWDLYRTEAQLRTGLQALVLGGYVSIYSTIVNFTSNEEQYAIRFAATGFNTDGLGVTLALLVPIAWYLAMTERNTTKRRYLTIANLAFVPAASVAIGLTGTRTALLALVPSLFYVLWTFFRIGRGLRVGILVAVIAGVIAVQNVVPETSILRLASTGAELTGGDLNGRIEIWEDGLQTFAEYPLAGVGAAAYREASPTKSVAHNTYLSVATELGIIGFILFAATVAAAAWKVPRLPKTESRFLAALLTSLAIGSASLTFEGKKIGWLILGFTLSGGMLHVVDEFGWSPTRILRRRGLPAYALRSDIGGEPLANDKASFWLSRLRRPEHSQERRPPVYPEEWEPRLRRRWTR